MHVLNQAPDVLSSSPNETAVLSNYTKLYMARYNEFHGVCSITEYNLMLVKLTRWAQRAIGNLEWCLGIEDLIGMYIRQGIQLLVSIAD